jgi:hypothetical protein
LLNGDFQNKKEIVAGATDARHYFGNPLGIREGFVYRVAQFLNQAFEIIV